MQWLTFDKDRPLGTYLEDDVLEFCLHSEVHKYLGLSFTDLMQLDLPTYTKIKELINQENIRRSDQMDRMKKETKQRSDKILNQFKKNT